MNFISLPTLELVKVLKGINERIHREKSKGSWQIQVSTGLVQTASIITNMREYAAVNQMPQKRLNELLVTLDKGIYVAQSAARWQSISKNWLENM